MMTLMSPEAFKAVPKVKKESSVPDEILLTPGEIKKEAEDVVSCVVLSKFFRFLKSLLFPIETQTFDRPPEVRNKFAVQRSSGYFGR